MQKCSDLTFFIIFDKKNTVYETVLGAKVLKINEKKIPKILKILQFNNCFILNCEVFE
jgi:hypothetical protein